MPTYQERVAAMAKEGKLHTLWKDFKGKCAAYEDDGPGKKKLAALFKEFDGGLSGQLKKLEQSTDLTNARKHAVKAADLCGEYLEKVKAAKIGGLTETALKKALTALKDNLDAKVAEIDEILHSVALKIQSLSKQGRLKDFWTAIKSGTQIIANKEGDKDDRKDLAKLYTKLDSGLSKVIAKFEQTKDLEKAKALAQEAIAICDDYYQKIREAELGAKFNLPLVGNVKALKEFFVEWSANIDEVS
jgi:hypothetical protein